MYTCWHTEYIHVYIYGFIENMTSWYTANGETWTSPNLGATNEISYFGRMWVSDSFNLSPCNANTLWEFRGDEKTYHFGSVHDTPRCICKSSSLRLHCLLRTFNNKSSPMFGESILRFLDVTKSIKIPPKNDWMPSLLLSGNDYHSYWRWPRWNHEFYHEKHGGFPQFLSMFYPLVI